MQIGLRQLATGQPTRAHQRLELRDRWPRTRAHPRRALDGAALAIEPNPPTMSAAPPAAVAPRKDRRLIRRSMTLSMAPPLERIGSLRRVNTRCQGRACRLSVGDPRRVRWWCLLTPFRGPATHGSRHGRVRSRHLAFAGQHRPRRCCDHWAGHRLDRRQRPAGTTPASRPACSSSGPAWPPASPAVEPLAVGAARRLRPDATRRARRGAAEVRQLHGRPGEVWGAESGPTS